MDIYSNPVTYFFVGAFALLVMVGGAIYQGASQSAEMTHSYVQSHINPTQ